MKFEVVSVGMDGKSRTRTYDNITNEIFDRDELVDLRSDPKYACLIRESECEGDKSVYHKKSRTLRQIRIQVGTHCNFHCKYCGQQASDKVIPIYKDSAKEVEEFLNKLEANVSEVRSILFTGGEPLVYKKRLIPLAKGLRELYPKVRLSMITNGSLFDKATAEWCLDNRINLLISHDGPSFTAYRAEKDILDDQNVIEGIRYYIDENKRSDLGLSLLFNVVVTPENSELDALPAFFRNKIQRDVSLQFESIVKKNSDTEAQVTDFDDRSASTLINAIFKAGMNTDPSNPLRDFSRLAIKPASRIVARKNLNDIQFSCDNAQADTVAVDLNGVILACQAYPASKTGYGTLDELDTACCSLPVSWHVRKDCLNCPVLVSCLGGCSIQSPSNHEITCRTLRLWHTGLFYIAWHRLFLEVIQSIEPLD